MIKKLQLRGISRTPSDRMTSDGGCAESLNVQLHAGEIAPMPKPEMMKDPAGNKISVDGDILFIHKGIGYENLIYRDGHTLYWLSTLGESGSGTIYDQLQDEDSEQINDITAVGNTLVVSTTVDMYYILRKEDGYHLLGNRIPVPDIHFRIGNLDKHREDVVFSWADTYGHEDDTFEFRIEGSESDFALELKHDNIGDVTHFGSRSLKNVFNPEQYNGFFTTYLERVWNAIDKELLRLADDGKALFPFFVRYAVRLYDGTLYAQSIPVLIGADIGSFFAVGGILYQWIEQDVITVTTYPLYASGYSLLLQCANDGRLDGWEDIVTGVDIFISPQIIPPQRNAASVDFSFIGTNNPKTIFNYDIQNFILDPFYAVQHQDLLILDYQATHLAKSYTIDEFKALSGEVVLDEINFSSDYLYLKESLKEESQSMHHVYGKSLFNYNKRLLVTDAKQELYHGYPFLHSVKWDDMAQSPIRFVYHLRGDNGEATVICCDENGNRQITPKSAPILENLPIAYHEVPVAWLAYPDSRCYQVDVYHLGRQTVVASYKMTAMSQVDVAYAFIGFGKPILQEASFTPNVPESEDSTYEMPSTLLVSKSENPFVFPADEAVTFTAGRIMNLAAVTIPLSEGQAGQFDMYVFTDEGIYALSPDPEGSFRTSHCVSRDILISKDAVAGIEQGVFFAAARGLLLLRGSTVTKVSDAIEGPTITMDSDLMASISEKHFGGMVLEPQQPFHEFLSGCRIAYDYASTRIILMNEAHRTMYVYKFDTQTWHRMDMGLGYPVRALNSFPEALIVTRAPGNDGTQTVYNFSVVLESAHAEVAPGLIITRPFDLGEPDVRKAVRDLRVRGNCHRHDVSYILFGSFDGIHWVRLRSLHGGSFKQFRMMILTGLSPTERISWVDVDYDTRFTNKLR